MTTCDWWRRDDVLGLGPVPGLLELGLALLRRDLPGGDRDGDLDGRRARLERHAQVREEEVQAAARARIHGRRRAAPVAQLVEDLVAGEERQLVVEQVDGVELTGAFIRSGR